jgi:hypothetical protein
MIHDELQEGIPDPVLSAAMAEIRDELPRDIDWDKLRCSITGKAEMTLARKRAARRVSLPKSLVPLAAAAAIALSLWSGPSIIETIRGSAAVVQAAAPLNSDDILEEVLGSDLTEQEFRLVVTGRADPEALLAFAIGER